MVAHSPHRHAVGGPVLRIQFSLATLARTRLLTVRSPVVETLFALRLLGHRAGAPQFGGWRRAVEPRMGVLAERLAPFATSPQPTADLFLLECDTFHLTPSARVECGRDRPGWPAAAEQFHQLAIAPYWKRVRAHLEADRAARSHVLVRSGVEELLGGLYPRARWSGSVLEIPAPYERTVRLEHQGLLVTPSLFHQGPPTVLLSRGDRVQPVLVYPAPLSPTAAEALWDAGPPDRTALIAVMGRTRANLLLALDSSRTTGELGRRLGVSPAAVSQQTSVLREAGLITTHRKQNTALHSLTPLGELLTAQVG